MHGSLVLLYDFFEWLLQLVLYDFQYDFCGCLDFYGCLYDFLASQHIYVSTINNKMKKDVSIVVLYLLLNMSHKTCSCVT